MVNLVQQGNKKVLMVNDTPYIALAGEVHNSDSSSPEYMEHIWEIAEGLGMNTLLLPVSWEMVEPEEDTLDFSVPQELVEQAREQGKNKAGGYGSGCKGFCKIYELVERL